jgi:hypothetical protein
MTTKIETLGNWSAQACLHSALEEVEPDDAVIVVSMRGDGPPRWWTANVKTSDAVFMAECVKQKVMDDLKEVEK